MGPLKRVLRIILAQKRRHNISGFTTTQAHGMISLASACLQLISQRDAAANNWVRPEYMTEDSKKSNIAMPS